MSQEDVRRRRRALAHGRGDHSLCNPARRCGAPDVPVTAFGWSSPLQGMARRGPHDLAADLADKIRAGALPAGARLPTHYALVGAYDASLTTVRRAMVLLRDQGLVEGAKGHGVFVAGSPPG